uniref:Glucuronosyltransferase n=1 Tax=Ascaris lumbricoides TaxID=6252 RepID=A0A0M3IWF7_ASCLU
MNHRFKPLRTSSHADDPEVSKISFRYYLRHDRTSYDVRSFECRVKVFRDVLVEQVSIGILGERIIKHGARKAGFDNGFKDLISVIKSFIEAFNSLVDYRLIWSIKIKLPKRLASHVMTISWAPQSAILHDNRTKLFFTHAGLKRYIISHNKQINFPHE